MKTVQTTLPFSDTSVGMKRKFADLTAIKQIHTKSATLNLGEGSVVDFQRGVYTPQAASQLRKALQNELSWERREITMFGKRVFQPRLIAYLGDPEAQYTYSGETMHPAPWHPLVSQLKHRLEELTAHSYNSCLINWYRNGQDSMGWHSDNEPLYGPTPTIAMISLGATRDFVLRANADHSRKHFFPMAAGDVLVMRGATQLHWTHSVPKRAKEGEGRISLTFRQIVQPEAKKG